MSNELTLTNKLSDKEKILLGKRLFSEHKNINDLSNIKNIGQYLANNFSKIDGFQYKWSSLITNNPLLFEDIDYLRTKQHIKNTITEEEIQAYNDGKLTELYATLENMLICNLKYYDRIMSLCTIVFLNYIRLNAEEITSQYITDITYLFDMTPTQLWCAAMTNSKSTKFELEYGWNVELDDSETPLESNWDKLSKNKLFAIYTQYRAFLRNTNGFRETLISDVTSNHKLAYVCSKFTSTSTAINTDQLNTIYDYSIEIEQKKQKLYNSLHSCLMRMYNNDDSQFGIFVFSSEFYIYTTKFSLRVYKVDNKISKDYLANSYECFAAESYLVDSIKEQIEWSKYEMSDTYTYDKEILISLLYQMLKEDYRNIVCFKRMNNYGVVSQITFSGMFNNVKMKEEYLIDNKVRRTRIKTLSKRNMSKYIIESGYYLFGTDEDIHNFADSNINKTNIISHYKKYCIPVLTHMESVIQLHTLSKNDIIDFVCLGNINPSKLNNENIRYTSIDANNTTPKKIMKSMILDSHKTKNNKSYWKVIED